MPKDATVGARVDAELKEKAGAVFDKMGLPMSLGIELFLRQVAEKGKLPFSLGDDGDRDPESRRRERDFWRAFTVWHFDAWPHFESEAAEERAFAEYGYERDAPGFAIVKLIDGKEPLGEADRRNASRDLCRLQSIVCEAKELIYWALGMDKVFVPALSAEYADQADDWRLGHVRARARDRGALIADGVVGARYFGIDDDAEAPASAENASEEALMDAFGEWFMECPAGDDLHRVLLVASERARGFEDIRELLVAADLMDDFESYIEDMGLAARQEED